MRVLVVSDDPNERMRASSALQLYGKAEVVDASAAREAAAKIADATFDVLVVDGDLAPKGGFSFLYEARLDAQLRGADTPPALVMIARDQDRWLAEWAGFDDLALKPVDPFRLAKQVETLFGKRAAEAGKLASGDEVTSILESEGTAGLTP